MRKPGRPNNPKSWARKGYKVVMFRARVEVIAAIDEMVDARNKTAAASSLAEPVVSRTTIILEALKQLMLAERAA